jgi:hypothetical protein
LSLKVPRMSPKFTWRHRRALILTIKVAGHFHHGERCLILMLSLYVPKLKIQMEEKKQFCCFCLLGQRGKLWGRIVLCLCLQTNFLTRLTASFFLCLSLHCSNIASG